MVLVRLKALPKPGEVLRTSSRPDLVLFQNSSVHLGRTSQTQISDTEVSRKACAIYSEDGKVTLNNIKTTVWVNGIPHSSGVSLTLQQGDKLSLKAGARYEYEVQYESNDNDMTSHAVTSSAAPPQNALPGRKRSAAQAGLSSQPEDQNGLPRTVLDEFYCALCLDLQVQSTMLVPCGHAYCRDCVLRQVYACPTCRSPIQARVQNRPINNMLQSMTHYFPADDVAVYQRRTGGGGGGDATATGAALPSVKHDKPPQAASGGSVEDAICID